jgi:hypothetical protein
LVADKPLSRYYRSLCHLPIQEIRLREHETLPITRRR